MGKNVDIYFGIILLKKKVSAGQILNKQANLWFMVLKKKGHNNAITSKVILKFYQYELKTSLPKKYTDFQNPFYKKKLKLNIIYCCFIKKISIYLM